jgi:hypothetical protein
MGNTDWVYRDSNYYCSRINTPFLNVHKNNFYLCEKFRNSVRICSWFRGLEMSCFTFFWTLSSVFFYQNTLSTTANYWTGSSNWIVGTERQPRSAASLPFSRIDCRSPGVHTSGLHDLQSGNPVQDMVSCHCRVAGRLSSSTFSSKFWEI